MFGKKKREPVKGLSADRIAELSIFLHEEYDEAKARQKSPDAKPSEYMRGIAFAYEMLDRVEMEDL